MEILKYTKIKNREQYDQYCNILEDLIAKDNDKSQDEIELLTLLIEKWDSEQNSFQDKDPIQVLETLMKEHNLRSKDLADILDLSKGTISKMLNYRKGLSRDTIRKLAEYFKVSQESFNRPYPLIINEINRYEGESFHSGT